MVAVSRSKFGPDLALSFSGRLFGCSFYRKNRTFLVQDFGAGSLEMKYIVVEGSTLAYSGS